MRSQWLGGIVVASLVGISGQGEARGQAATQEPTKQAEHKESINSGFLNPKLDIEASVKRYEGEDREVAAKRQQIAGAMNLEPGMAVADIGAGTGLFTRVFAEKVGSTGKVYAVEVSPVFLKYIAEQAAKAGQDGVIKAIKGSQDGTNLEPRSVDAVFICDAYHHFDKPEVMLASIRRALKPGGRLFIVDFDKKPDSPAFIKSHMRATQEEVIKEIEAAGFKRIELTSKVELKENFLAGFQKVRRADGTPKPAATSAPR